MMGPGFKVDLYNCLNIHSCSTQIKKRHLMSHYCFLRTGVVHYFALISFNQVSHKLYFKTVGPGWLSELKRFTFSKPKWKPDACKKGNVVAINCILV